MPLKKPKALYRTLLREAFDITKKRPLLWFFGIFATLVSSGGVCEVAFRGFKRVMDGERLLQSLLEGTVPGYDLVVQYILQIPLLDQTRVSISLAILTILAMMVVAFAVMSQIALIIGASGKKPAGFRELLSTGGYYFLHVFVIDILSKSVVAIALMATTLLLLLFHFESTVANALAYFVMFLVFFAVVIVVNIISMISIVEAVKSRLSVLHSIWRAAEIFYSNRMVTIELGIMLFFASLIAGIAAGFLIVALSIPYTLVMIAVLFTAPPMGYFMLIVIAVTIILLIIALTGGIITAFQYAVWVKFHEIAAEHGIRSKIHRLWHG